VDPADRPWRPDGGAAVVEDTTLQQVLADADDHDKVNYNEERARLEALFGTA
jgi:hypothetical protein